MKIFFIVLFIFALIAFVVYFPLLYKIIRLKGIKKNLYSEIKMLDDLYKKYIIIITHRLGEGVSQNSDTKFVDAHKNQEFAVNSILSILE